MIGRVGLVCLLGCGGTRAASTPVGDATAHEPPRPPITCPEGSRLRGKSPPAGNRMWCDGPGGESHGPFIGWYSEGQKRSEGTFVHGKPDGVWRAWYRSGELRSEARYDKGERVGEVIELDPWGRPLPARPERTVVVEEEPPPRPQVVIMGEDLQVGVAECDAYLHYYFSCIEKRLPASTRDQVRDGMRQTAEAWRKMANGPNRDTLARTCKEAHEAIKKAGKSWGC